MLSGGCLKDTGSEDKDPLRVVQGRDQWRFLVMTIIQLRVS